MLLLGLDFETTGLDTTKSSVVEVGMALWDTDLHAPVKLAGFLVDPGPVVWEPGAAAKNGLSPELCAKYGMVDETALRQVLSHLKLADAVVAHNGNNFDFPLLESWAKRYGLEVPNKLRIDTDSDCERPPKMSNRLTYWAADHGFLNPFPHRAMFDVMTMLRILDTDYDINVVAEIAKSPTLLVEALVSFAQKDLAKQVGFHAEYEGTKFRRWSLAVKECFLDKKREECRVFRSYARDENGETQEVTTPGFEIRIVKK
jgi:DNA polymerase III subunit epsilon